jgi:hypothetical protein
MKAAVLAAGVVAACGGGLPIDSQDVAGCYRFAQPYFRWNTTDTIIGRHWDSTATIELANVPQRWMQRRDSAALTVRVPRVADSTLGWWGERSYWEPDKSGGITLVWGNGFHGSEYRLRPSDSGLIGSAHGFSDVQSLSDLLPFLRTRWPVTAVRVLCARM